MATVLNPHAQALILWSNGPSPHVKRLHILVDARQGPPSFPKGSEASHLRIVGSLIWCPCRRRRFGRCRGGHVCGSAFWRSRSLIRWSANSTLVEWTGGYTVKPFSNTCMASSFQSASFRYGNMLLGSFAFPFGFRAVFKIQHGDIRG